ncbi:hypothetical protein MN608_09946 [Microdochium nivale]|nr:hypothetical protein MN608_09946 [Microdochium nivale]
MSYHRNEIQDYDSASLGRQSLGIFNIGDAHISINSDPDIIEGTSTGHQEAESVGAAPSLISDETISSMASWAQILQAVKEFVNILTGHYKLGSILCEIAAFMPRARIETEMTKMILQFSTNIQGSASTPIEGFAARLVRRRARMVSQALVTELDSRPGLNNLQFRLLDSQQRVETRALIESFLEGLLDSSSTPNPSALENKGETNESDSGMSDSDTEEDLEVELPSLSHLKTFIVESPAFFHLIADVTKLRDQQAKREDDDQTPYLSSAVNSIDETDGSYDASNIGTLPSLHERTLLRIWNSIVRPRLLPGYQRITYTCGCGKSSYADVQELYPGGAQNLESKLRRSAALAAGMGQGLHHIPTATRTASSDIGLSTRPPSLQVSTGQDSISTAIATGQKNTSNIQDGSSSNKD